jgi:hypothetical protein
MQGVVRSKDPGAAFRPLLGRRRTRGRRNAANESVLAAGKRVLIDHEQHFDSSWHRSAELDAPGGRLPAPLAIQNWSASGSS